MKKISLGLLICGLSSLVLAGCTTSNSSQTTPVKSGAPAAAQKTGTTTKTGLISKKGEKFYIQEVGKQAEEIDSYTVDLGIYVGQTVTVQGQFSGNTLFVGTIQ